MTLTLPPYTGGYLQPGLRRHQAQPAVHDREHIDLRPLRQRSWLPTDLIADGERIGPHAMACGPFSSWAGIVPPQVEGSPFMDPVNYRTEIRRRAVKSSRNRSTR